MTKRTLIQKLERLIETKCQRIRRALDDGKSIKGRCNELELLREVLVVLERKPHVAKPGPRGPIALGQQPRVDRPLQSSETKIIALIESDPEFSFALIDLINELDMPAKTVKNCLLRLVRDGYVVRHRRGFYGVIRSL